MTFLLFVLVMTTPSLMEWAGDPFTGWLPAAIPLADLDCEPVTTQGALAVEPGLLPERAPRGDFFERRAVICRQRLTARGALRAQDEALLSDLRASAGETAALVAGLEPAGPARTWLVEVYYPDAALAQKIGFAVKDALFDRQLRVSDRVPTLAAGDLEVLGALRPDAAYPLACARFAAAGAIGPGDALLAVVARDSRETVLHIGVCADGAWRWLR